MEFKVDTPVGFTAPPRPETALTERYNPPICHSIITPFGQSKAPVSSAVPPGAQSQPVLFMPGGDGQRSGGKSTPLEAKGGLRAPRPLAYRFSKGPHQGGKKLEKRS